MRGNKKAKLLFLVPNLNGGGAERVMANLCQSINKNKYEIVLVLLKKEGQYLELIPSDIKVIDLNISRVRFGFAKIARIIWQIKPDIVFSTLGHLNAMLGATRSFLPKKTKLIAREANIVSQMNYSKGIKMFYKLFYKSFDAIICQSQDMQDDLLKFITLDTEKIYKINNPINCNYIDDMIKINEQLFSNDAINLLTVGRCTYQKGYDLFLKSFAKFKHKERYRLTILGEGELKEELKRLVRKLQIEEYIIFLGFKTNPYKYMKQADIFISSSRFEGFPNAVLESLYCGTPVIANKYKGGINEILDEPILGEICNIEDSKYLESCLQKFSNKTYSTSSKITQMMKERYSIEKITQKYEIVFEKLLNN